MGIDLIIRFYSSITRLLVFYFFDKKKKPCLISNKLVALYRGARLCQNGSCRVPTDSNSHRKKIVCFPSLHLDKCNLMRVYVQCVCSQLNTITFRGIILHQKFCM